MIASDPTMTAGANPTAVELVDASVDFGGGVKGVDQVDLVIRRGERVALIGPSGCGKTTLLRVIAGLQPLTSGTCQRRSQLGAGDTRAGVSFVFQQPSLLPWLSVEQNVALPMRLGRRRTLLGSEVMSQRVAALLRDVELDDASTRWPHQCSGGMQMRASIARSLVTQPSLLLLDEPFAALDDVLRNQLSRLVLRLWQQHQFTAVMVTHHIAEAIRMSERICVLDRGRVRDVFDNPVAAMLIDETIGDVQRTPRFAEFYGVISDALADAANSKRGVRETAGRP